MRYVHTQTQQNMVLCMDETARAISNTILCACLCVWERVRMSLCIRKIYIFYAVAQSVTVFVYM